MDALVKLFPKLEKAAVAGPGKRELARAFFAHQEWAKATEGEHPFYALIDPYGTVLVREKDVSRIIETLLPPVDERA